MLRILLLSILIAVAGWFTWRWLKQDRVNSAGSNSNEPDAERELLQLCFGDKAQVERLIGLEIARTPASTRSEAAVAAVRVYKRDNR